MKVQILGDWRICIWRQIAFDTKNLTIVEECQIQILKNWSLFSGFTARRNANSPNEMQ